MAAWIRRLKGPYRRWLADVAVALCLAAMVVGIAVVLMAPHESGIKGIVRCAPAVHVCGSSDNKAVVYITIDRVPFNPFNPPPTSYQTDAHGHFQIPLAPGTYWVAAEKEGGVLASNASQAVIVRAGALTDVTIELDLHLPQ